MSRQNLKCLYKKEVVDIRTLANMAGLTYDTVKSRLVRTAELEEVEGQWLFVCEDRHMVPSMKVGRKPRTTTVKKDIFKVTRYSPSTDGGDDVMARAAKSQSWLRKPIRTGTYNDQV